MTTRLQMTITYKWTSTSKAGPKSTIKIQALSPCLWN